MEDCHVFGHEVEAAMRLSLANHLFGAFACFAFEFLKEPSASILLFLRMAEVIGVLLQLGSSIFAGTLVIHYLSR